MQVYILTENGPQKMKWSRKSNMNPSQNIYVEHSRPRREFRDN